jgi:hypothetical protein
VKDHPRPANEQDLVGTPDEYAPTIFERGITGWDDAEDWFELGDETNGGLTVVRVQLFKGRDPNTPPKTGVAQGHRVLVALSDGFFRIPPKGSECIVAFPGGDVQTAGAGILLATIPRPRVKTIYGHLEDEEACIHAGSADGSNPARIVTKKDGSVVIMTETDDGQTVYLRVAKNALRFVAPWGTFRFDASGFHLKTQWGARLDLGGVGGMPPPASDMTSYATMSAHSVKLDGLVLLGTAGPVGDYESVTWLPFTGFPPMPMSPLPLVPPMAPVMFLSPYVKVSTGI